MTVSIINTDTPPTPRFDPEFEKQRLLLEQSANVAPSENLFEAFLNYWKPYPLLAFFLRITFLYNRGYRNYLNPRVVEVPVTINNLPKALHGLRILQVSDLHLDLEPDIARILRKRLSGVAYDLVVFTGDFQNGHLFSEKAMTLMIELLPSFRPPFYASLGNHDTLDIVAPLEKAGMRFLVNEHVRLKYNGCPFSLVGVDDPYQYQTDDIPKAIQGIPQGETKILLSHAPSNYHEAEAAGIDYFISGHTHGGQICGPRGKPYFSTGRVPSEIFSGRWKHHQMHGYTSRGLGACHLPVRYNCQGEITLHTLKSPDA